MQSVKTDDLLGATGYGFRLSAAERQINERTNQRGYMPNWYIYEGTGERDESKIARLPPPPPWRQFAQSEANGGDTAQPAQPSRRVQKHFFQVDEEERRVVNAALYLRRPLLVTGPPGAGKSTLAHAVAHELGLGEVLVWPITSRSSLQEALYRYDAIGRLQESNLSGQEAKATPPIGKFIRLGPLGTAFADSQGKPRVLLIDEIDKSDIDLPNDLLNIFEEGRFEIPELARYVEPRVEVYTHNSDRQIPIQRGKVICKEFPFVVLTSNGERELPPPLLRRCLQLTLPAPTDEKLERIVKAHFDDLGDDDKARVTRLIQHLLIRRNEQNEYIATDQLLNAIYLFTRRTLESDGQPSRLDIDDQTLQAIILKAISEFEHR